MDRQSAQPRGSCVRQFACLRIISYMTSLLGALRKGGALTLTKTSPNPTHLHRVPAAGQGSWKAALHPSLHVMVRASVPDVTFV